MAGTKAIATGVFLGALLLMIGQAAEARKSQKDPKAPSSCNHTCCTPKKMSPSEAKAFILPFYQNVLTVNNLPGEPAATLTRLYDTDALSYGGWSTTNRTLRSDEEYKTLEQSIGLFTYFWDTIPDLEWIPVEFYVASKGCHDCNNQILVRSIGAGTPIPPNKFFGVEVSGTKSFKIDTFDVFTIRCGKKISEVHHVEDWASAIAQVSA